MRGKAWTKEVKEDPIRVVHKLLVEFREWSVQKRKRERARNNWILNSSLRAITAPSTTRMINPIVIVTASIMLVFRSQFASSGVSSVLFNYVSVYQKRNKKNVLKKGGRGGINPYLTLNWFRIDLFSFRNDLTALPSDSVGIVLVSILSFH